MTPCVVEKVDIAGCEHATLRLHASHRLVGEKRVGPNDEKLFAEKSMVLASSQYPRGNGWYTSDTECTIDRCKIIEPLRQTSESFLVFSAALGGFVSLRFARVR